MADELRQVSNGNRATLATYIAVVVTILGSLIAGSMRFASVEQRLSTVESNGSTNAAKLDSISAALARIEGRLDEARDERQRTKQ